MRNRESRTSHEAQEYAEEAEMKDATLAGKRVLLRPPSKRDAKEFITLNRESAAFHKGLVSPPTNAEQFAKFIERFRRPDCSCFLVCRVEDGAIVGAMNVSQIFLVSIIM